MTLRQTLKATARAAAAVVVFPQVLSFRLRAQLIGPNRALEGSTQLLAGLPGLVGQYLRRAFLSQTLAACAASSTVEFGTIFSQVGTRIEDNVYIGPRCHIGLAMIERDVLIAAGVHIPSGAHTHGTGDVSVAISEQEQRRQPVRIGAGSWIGSAAVVMADVGRDSIIGAGAVVTRPIPDRVLAAGIPARVVRERSGSVIQDL